MAGTYIFGQNPPFGGFASNPNLSNSRGSAFQQPQTTFSSSPFGLPTPVGASTQNACGTVSSSAFGPPSTSPFTVANTLGTSSISFVGVSNTSAPQAPISFPGGYYL
ncbi:hypothetical protein U1Q18_002769 [Sarracenia purpurea var. burkii]